MIADFPIEAPRRRLPSPCLARYADTTGRGRTKQAASGPMSEIELTAEAPHTALARGLPPLTPEPLAKRVMTVYGCAELAPYRTTAFGRMC